MTPLVKTVLLAASILHLTSSQKSNCDTKETCSECIQEIDCVWCVKPNSEIADDNHCVSANVANSNSWCNQSFTINPQKTFEIVDNRDINSNDGGDTIQMQPQRVKLRLRKGEEFALSFKYAQARNYPVDLYYLMDLSASMEPHREKLGALGGQLADAMKNVTSKFKLGFGSYVDKVDSPFVSTVPEKLKTPCTLTTRRGEKIVCEPPYSYKNHLSLSSDVTLFSDSVSKVRVSGNLDSPEGGLDALMQAIVCKNEIGWRSQARHLLVFSTDAEFHVAGDGKLAGVVEPNDAQCHMANNEYTDYLKYDYPSVSQINYVAKQNNLNIIFAIVRKPRIVDSYKRLSEQIENSNTGALDENSINVVQLVLDNYNKIVDSVTITANSSSDVQVKMSSNCTHPKENGCNQIHVGEIVDFTATIKPLACSKSGSNTKIISIKPEAINETIIVELEVLCDCDCETNNFSTPNAAECTNAGDLKCGVCQCNSGRFGRNCECDTSTSDVQDTKNCKASPDDTELCSGLGICQCGKCECDKRKNLDEKIYGKYCQCDNFSCESGNGGLCFNRGTCNCGKCDCHAGWNGTSCECPDSKLSCVSPADNDGKICTGRGSCECGRCKCISDEHRYSGKYCEECPTCPGQRCDFLRDCVECKVYGSGLYDKATCKAKCQDAIEIVEKLTEDIDDENIKFCRFPDKYDCMFAFQYEYYPTDKQDVKSIKAEKKKVCPGPTNILAWVLGVIGTTVAAGILLLIIWKILTTIHDRREYAKFENERKNLRWHRNDNPLYKQATSSFPNPVYNRNRNSKRFSFNNS